MPTTTAKPRSRAKKAQAQSIVTPQDVLDVANDVTTNVLIERAAEMRVIVLGALAGVNVHQLGPPGTAKSLGLRSFAERIDGARYFEKAVHAQMPADAIVGGYDMPKFASTGEFARNYEHYAPNAHIINIDEITRANGPTLDAILPLYNAEERRFEANGGMQQSPCLFFVSASNYMPDPDDAHLGALVDRMTLMQLIDYVRADDSFKEMFRRHHSRRRAERTGTAKPVTITLDQFMAAQAEVEAVEPTPQFLDAYAELRRNAKVEGLMVSDRRWMELGRVARASAWLGGRDGLIPEDLAAIEHGLWRERNEIPLAHKVCLPYHGRFEREATQKRQEAAAPLAEWEQIRPQVEGTPPNEDIEPEVLRTAVNVSRKIDAVKARVDELLAEAQREQRDAAGLRDLANELEVVQKWYLDNNLPTRYKG